RWANSEWRVANRTLLPIRYSLFALVDGSLALRGIEREGRDLDVEPLAGGGHHAVAAGHEAGRRRQRNPAGVFEVFPRLEPRLLGDHAGAAHLLQAALRVGDLPVARLELDRLAPEVGQHDGVGPEEIAVLRGGAVGHEARCHTDLDLTGDRAIG